ATTSYADIVANVGIRQYDCWFDEYLRDMNYPANTGFQVRDHGKTGAHIAVTGTVTGGAFRVVTVGSSGSDYVSVSAALTALTAFTGGLILDCHHTAII